MLQLTIANCTRENAEHISELMLDFGAVSVTMCDKEDNPILEPELGTTPLWPEVTIQSHYADHEEIDVIIDTLKQNFSGLEFKVEEIIEQNWVVASQSDVKPMLFGKNLWICPSWLTPPVPEAVNLILDPGLAFGTGTHGTTSLCLTWLENAGLKDKVLIDYGCGSGILSLAALKLGAKHAYAVDIDEQALIATKNNAEVNQISANQLNIGYPEELDTPVDLILANILLSPLLSLKDRFKKLLVTKGTLVVSGILAAQIDEICMAYADAFKYQTHSIQNEWALVTFIRNN